MNIGRTVKSPRRLAILEKTPSFQRSITVGMRIPKDFFISTGIGESDITVHAGSYHLALRDAGIEMCNIMTYSSILPDCANQIESPPELRHGAVLETIMAVATASKAEQATAGIIWGWLYDRSNGVKHGGLVCEYNGYLNKEQASRQLHESLDELYYNGYSDDFYLEAPTLIAESFIPQKLYGTALVSLNFVNYIIPILPEEN